MEDQSVTRKHAARAEKAAARAAHAAAAKAARAAELAAANAAFDAKASMAYRNVEGSIVWDATLDRGTRPSHGVMDGKRRNADGFFDGTGQVPRSISWLARPSAGGTRWLPMLATVRG